ncbi:protein of unknown function [Aminobacter niigataensis]|nr:protein of unknown function [Aminobacter niigataensis]
MIRLLYTYQPGRKTSFAAQRCFRDMTGENDVGSTRRMAVRSHAGCQAPDPARPEGHSVLLEASDLVGEIIR